MGQPAAMSFFQCRQCQSSVRVWNGDTMERLPEDARRAPDAAFVWGDRVFSCPACDTAYRMPIGAVYVIFNAELGRVQLVGRSRDAVRRIEWWKRPAGLYEAPQFVGVPLFTVGDLPDVPWLAEGIAWLQACEA